MAYVTFAIVGIFLSFNLPRIVVAGYEVSQTWLILHCVQNGSEYMPVLPFYYWDSISRLFMVINSSLNFLVYCTGSDQFKVSLNLPRGIYKLRSTFKKEMAEKSMLFVRFFDVFLLDTVIVATAPYSQLPGRLFSPSDICKKLSHHFLLHFPIGMGSYDHHTKYQGVFP